MEQLRKKADYLNENIDSNAAQKAYNAAKEIVQIIQKYENI